MMMVSTMKRGEEDYNEGDDGVLSLLLTVKCVESSGTVLVVLSNTVCAVQQS